MRLPAGHLSERLKIAAFFLVLGWGVLFALLPAAAAPAVPDKGAAPGPATFELREIAIFDKNPVQSDPNRLAVGAFAICSTEPDKAVKAYPKLKSKQPLYGKLHFDHDFTRGKWIEYHFVLDESGEAPPVEVKAAKSAAEIKPEKSLWQSLVEKFSGTADKEKPAKRAQPQPKLSRYDRLYIDLNRDLDLRNDPVRKPMKDPPWRMLSFWTVAERMAFDYVDIPVDYGPGIGIRPFRVLPWLTIDTDKDHTYRTMHFVATVARQGRIRIGGHAYEALLAQPYLLNGRFDRPVTALYLKPVNRKEKVDDDGGFAGGSLTTARWRDGGLYTTSATPLGDKLTVTPYRGDFGVFTVGPGGRDIKKITFHGSLASETMSFELQSDPAVPRAEQKDARQFKAPVGDYYPLWLSIDYGRLHLSLSDNYHSDGHPRGWDTPRNFFVKIRKDRPFTLDFSHKPAVLFASPAKDQQYKPGDEVSVKAVLIDPVYEIMIRGLYDESRKTKETIKLSGGKTTTHERPLSLDPTVTITNAAGKKAAEGPMPFG
jgi:hypothetical protein